jgi:N-acetylglucosamine-6-phosphate deacetylase
MSDQYLCVDLQVNGYAGVDFNRDDVSAEALHHACVRLREDGVAGILATIITDELPRMTARLARIAALRRQDALVGDVVWGVHVEGPFLNETPGFCGAHPAHAMRPADIGDMDRLLDAADGLVRMVTLAPERDSGLKLVRHLADRKILVSAGHCDPSLNQLRAAIDAGLSMFTHLGNGCPVTLHRHDNIIQRALSLRDRLTLSFVADGLHVPAPALGNYLRLAGFERSIVVTDAISAARLEPGRYTLGAQTVEIGPDGASRSADGSHFVGSTATMPRMAALLRGEVGLSEDEVRRLLSDNPRRLLASVAIGIPTSVNSRWESR